MDENHELLTPEEVAEWTGLSVGTLANLRYAGGGPKFIKLSRKTVRYFRRHVDEWLEAGVRERTGAPR